MNAEKQEAIIKKNLVNIVTVNIKRYIIAKHNLMPLLMSGSTKKCTKKKKCNGCKSEDILNRMNQYQGVVREACKAMEVLFDEQIDVKAIVEELGETSYEDPSEKKGKRDGKIILPENAPQDIKNVAQAIKEALMKNGMSGDMEIVDMKAENHGINPNDFEDFGDYIKAVHKARKMSKDIKAGKTTVEEVLTKSVEEEATEHPEDIKGKA
jgi:hypothetical protein